MSVEYVWVGIGGLVGANLRYALGRYIVGRVGDAFPYHTFVINLTGSLAIGVVLTLLTQRLVTDPVWRLLIVVGFLGGYTTFSSYTFETITLLQHGRWLRAGTYVIGSNVLGLAACYAGILIARALDR
jgi:CrcB protein